MGLLPFAFFVCQSFSGGGFPFHILPFLLPLLSIKKKK